MKKKTIALIVCLTLIIGCAIGGTIAWLTDQTAAVTNTFTAGDVDIDLTETDVENDGTLTANSYKMVPGNEIAKDPKVTVVADSEKCYLFVKVEKVNNPDNFLDYTIDSGWTSLVDADPSDIVSTDGVYFRIVDASAVAQDFYVLAGNKVTVKNNVTKNALDNLTESTLPQLKFTAYACQFANVNSEYQAWLNVQP